MSLFSKLLKSGKKDIGAIAAELRIDARRKHWVVKPLKKGVNAMAKQGSISGLKILERAVNTLIERRVDVWLNPPAPTNWDFSETKPKRNPNKKRTLNVNNSWSVPNAIPTAPQNTAVPPLTQQTAVPTPPNNGRRRWNAPGVTTQTVVTKPSDIELLMADQGYLGETLDPTTATQWLATELSFLKESGMHLLEAHNKKDEHKALTVMAKLELPTNCGATFKLNFSGKIAKDSTMEFALNDIIAGCDKVLAKYPDPNSVWFAALSSLKTYTTAVFEFYNLAS